VKRIVKAQTSKEDVNQFWYRKFNITSFLFKEQLAFVEDPAPFKVAVCSRRSGKTVACAAHLIHTAINNSGVICLYITLSRNNAKKIIWRDLVKICDTYNLDAFLDTTELSLTFRNGSVIYLSGAKDATEIEKFRGLPIKLCYIDECQSFKEYIKDLIDDVISPALMDYAGTLALIGTPGPIPVGYFYECSMKSDVWSKHSWTFWQNPFIAQKSGKTHQELMDRELKRRGVTISDPSIQREWFGIWVLDSESLLIKYKEKTNHYETLPPHKNFNYVMGVDVGHDDADAICVLAWTENEPTTYLIEEKITSKQGTTELATQIQEFEKKYKIDKIVMDFGGLGKKIGEEFIRRWKIPVEAADKARKMENVELLNDALRTGTFKAKNNSTFAQDSYKIEKDLDKSTPEKIVVSKRFHSDIADAVLYSFKLSPAYTYVKPPEKPKPGTKEYADMEVDEMFNREMEGLQAEDAYQKYLNGEEN
jgi:phage terminase large subunit